MSVDPPEEFVNDIGPLILELKNAYDSLAAIEVEHERARTVFQEVDLRRDLGHESVNHLANVFAYCLRHGCDPTQARLMLSLEEQPESDPYQNTRLSKFGVPINRNSNLMPYLKESPRKKSWWARLFRSQR